MAGRIWYFNSHPHEEDDKLPLFATILAWLFQLTSSRGGWQVYMKPYDDFDAFQLTSSRGGWPDWDNEQWRYKHFNSHPHEEDDIVWSCKALHHFISTHILTRRMTAIVLVASVVVLYFNSHPHEEDDERTKGIVLDDELFQLTSSRGGWQQF